MSAKEKIQAAPKEFLRRGLLTGKEKLQGQLRDAAEGGRREDTEADHTQAAARTTTQRVAYRLKKLAQGKKKARTEKPKTHADAGETRPDVSASGTQMGQAGSTDSAEPIRIKTKNTVQRSASVEYSHIDTAKFEPSQIKTKDACIQSKAAVPKHESTVINTVQSESQAAHTSQQRREKFIRERKNSVREAQSHSVSERVSVSPEQNHQPSQRLEQGRRKFMRERREQAAARRREKYYGSERAVPARQRDAGDVQPRHTATLSDKDRKRLVNNTVREAASNGKRQIKEARSGTKTVGRTTRHAVKGADSSRKIHQTGGRSAQAMGQAARAAVQARQRAVQATGAARRTTAAGKAMAKTAASALRGAVSAIRALMVPLAGGGGAVIAVVLVLCLVGALLASPLGIFFSGRNSGGQTQTISDVVRGINLEFDARLEELKMGFTYDEVSLSGSRASWIEILAVYAVKTAADPTDGQEVVTMTDGKKAQLKQVFWDMNELSGFTSTVPGEGDDEEDTTTLYITVTAKTAGEMADAYGFNADQRQQLAELLSDEYRDLWNAVLYGIGTGSSEIVTVGLSQVGNIGGQPYWSWYGFTSRVDWCAIFVSWCANECGCIDAGVIPKFSGCVQGSRWFKDRELWQDKSYTPNPGDIIFFDWDDPDGYSGPQDGVPDHVGIVEKVENGRVYTIEGNSGDQCCQRSYPVGYYEIYGYGVLYP